MTQQQKDELNKELCRLLEICWHEEDYLQARHCNIGCSCGFITTRKEELSFHASMSNPDFTSEAGRIKLLGIMRDRADWFRFLWRIMPDVPARDESGTRMLDNYVLNKTGRLAIAARDFLKAMEGK